MLNVFLYGKYLFIQALIQAPCMFLLGYFPPEEFWGFFLYLSYKSLIRHMNVISRCSFLTLTLSLLSFVHVFQRV